MSCGILVGVAGSEPPAMSISWTPASDPLSGFIVIFADDDGLDEDDVEILCLHCLLEEGDEQLGRGLDLAREHGQVDWDVEAGEWRVPDAWERVHGLRRRSA